MNARAFISVDQVMKITRQIESFIQTDIPQMPAEHVFYEDKNDARTLKQIQHMEQYHEFFHELHYTSDIRRLAEMLLGDEVVPQNLQYFNKPPSVGQPTPAHQDGYYFMLDPCEAVTFWLALDVTDEENGCVRYVRGSHQLGMRHHGRTSTLGFSQGITDFDDADRHLEEAAHARPGDLLAHHALTIHRAEGNRSTVRQRRALGFIYYAQRAKHDQEAHDRYQKQLAEDLTAMGKI